ncbi:beta-xylosidase [Mucilaginibacter sp. CSA2-8R]|uniref:GH39 family glycosyl hydrolase n=1 Tax=Mucilaginibacter sp. CSA2-8R TaxID=3141542 RepID=UPI00315C7758
MFAKNLKLILLTGLVACFGFTQAQVTAPVTIQVDLRKPIGPMKPIWAWFGYDEPNYTYMKDGKKLLTEIAQLSPVPVYVRAHSLLVTGDGKAALKWGSTNVYTEDANGKPVYQWNIIDSIIDTYVKRGMKPLAQIGFMPEALSTHPEPYRHHWKPGDPYTDIITGWAYPPKDYDKWAELVYQWVKHSVARYGEKEVLSWYWEVWNEPNSPYWKGTKEEFFKLYDYTVMAVKKSLPGARIGGADVTGNGTKWLNDFINHCLTGTNYATGKTGTPLNLILFHAKGSPKLVNGIVRMDVRAQLRNINDNFKMIASHPELKNTPIVIGESDPEGCAACGMATDPQNAYRNGTMYSSYTAAAFARKYELADQYGLNLIGAVTWAFEFEDQPWFYGFRDLATNGIDKPVLNVFRMFGQMKGNRVAATSNRMYALNNILDSSIRKAADVGVLAAKGSREAAVMLWSYHDDDQFAAPENVQVTVNGLTGQAATVTRFKIDQEHSNAYTVWKNMGSPQKPTAAQISQLQKAGQLQQIGQPQRINIKNNTITIPSALARQDVELLKITW